MLFPLYDDNPHRRFPWLTLMIIAANVAVMGWMVQAGQDASVDIAYRYGFIPKRVGQIATGKQVVVLVPKLDQQGEPDPNLPPQRMLLSADPSAVYLTFLTTMFLHGSWLHLVSNMWMLWVFGNNIEDRLGHFMYGCYYLLGGLAATVTHYATDPASALPIIGASGAVAAVLGGYAVTYPKAKVRTLVFVGIPLLLNLPALLVLGLWFVIETVLGWATLHGMVFEPVAHWAHVGGFVAGIALLPFFTLGTPPPGEDSRKEVEELFRFDDVR